MLFAIRVVIKLILYILLVIVINLYGIIWMSYYKIQCLALIFKQFQRAKKGVFILLCILLLQINWYLNFAYKL